MKILMATDGSRDAMTALIGATRLLRKDEVQADVLCVAPQLVLQGAATVSTARRRTRQAYKAEMRKESEQIVQRARHALDRMGSNAIPLVEFGSPADEIIGNYDLIVAGATGGSDVKHALLGSVSLKLAWNASSSVLVVRT